MGHFQRELANLFLYTFLQRRRTPSGILLNTQRRRPCCPRAFSPAFFQSRAAVHLFRPHLENMWLLLLQNGSRTLRWLELRLPAMLPTSRRPTGTLRQDLQSPMQWDKNVSSHLSTAYVWNSCYPQWLIKSFTKLSSYIVVCFPELVPQGVFLWWGLVLNRLHQASVCICFLMSKKSLSSLSKCRLYIFFRGMTWGRSHLFQETSWIGLWQLNSILCSLCFLWSPGSLHGISVVTVCGLNNNNLI